MSSVVRQNFKTYVSTDVKRPTEETCWTADKNEINAMNVITLFGSDGEDEELVLLHNQVTRQADADLPPDGIRCIARSLRVLVEFKSSTTKMSLT